MAELITLLIDLGLGALAYHLAYENRKRISTLEGTVAKIADILNRAGLS